MAIELKMTGLCDGCRSLDLEIERLYTGDGGCYSVAKCRNSGLCQRIEQHVMKYMNGNPCAPARDDR